MQNLEMLLVELFPQNTIKVDVENTGKIVINIDDKKNKIQITRNRPVS